MGINKGRSIVFTTTKQKSIPTNYLTHHLRWLYPSFGIIAILLIGLACDKYMGIESSNWPSVEQWATHEIMLLADADYAQPYETVEVAVVFSNEKGDTLRRPAFWDGEKVWKVRFAPPDTGSLWHWVSESNQPKDAGLQAQRGGLRSVPSHSENTLFQHGLLKMSVGKRSVVHADGHPFLLVADTPWAIPFRATQDQVEHYATDRQQKGFNAALLMSLQPDMKAEGPVGRNTIGGFERAFLDLSEGHIKQLQPAYFQYLDSLVAILLEHEIVPVWQPVFHGFGWKGLDVLGNVIEPSEYVRYVRYLLARYGSYPAFWLIAGDNGGRDPGVKEAGEFLQMTDAYQQPTGLHYNPCDDYMAAWAVENPLKHCMHFNQSFQAADWLDFQWAQTGHESKHQYHKVSRMYDNVPTKAVANGEPTYEGMNDGQNGLGWWQGEEAWMQLMSGGSMGVVYGAASLWQWKITADETGWTSWAQQAASWQEAMEMEGATYVGLLGKILGQLPTTDIEKRTEWASNGHPLLAKKGLLYLSYLNQGGAVQIWDLPAGLSWQWINPKNGTVVEQGVTQRDQLFTAPSREPWVLICKKV